MTKTPLKFGSILVVILILALNSTQYAAAEGAKKKKAAKAVPAAPTSSAPAPIPVPEPAVAQPTATPPAPAAVPAESPITVTTPSEPPTVAEQDKLDKKDEGGLLGPVRIGPAISVIGFPTPFRFGIETNAWNWGGLTFDYGFFPTLSFSNVKVKYNSWRVTGRVHPFQGAFFLGVGLGKQTFEGELTQDISGTAVKLNLNVSTTMVLPHLGWRWGAADGGFFFGMEFGVQLASSSTAALTTDASAAIQATTDYTTAKNDIESKGRTFGQTTLPHFALVQMGWMF